MPWTMVDGWTGRAWVDERGTRTFYIRQRRGAKRYDVSTRAHTLRAALKELERFEMDPDAYRPQGVEDALAITDRLVQEYRNWCEVRPVPPGKQHLDSQCAIIKWWGVQLKGRDLTTLKLTHIFAALAGHKNRAKRMVAIKHLFTFLRQCGRIEAAEDPTLDALPVPASKPAQDGERGSKVIPEADYLAVLPYLAPFYADACRIMWGTGCHVSEVVRFHSSGRIEDPPAGSPPWVSGVMVWLHKGGHQHRLMVPASVADPARRLKTMKGRKMRAVHKAIEAACEKAMLANPKMERWTPGRFRHTLATRALERGQSPAAIALALGHTSAATTLRWYSTTATVPAVDV